ncbi:penicillin-binding protein activator [Alphaproteobacteria bacterium]|nr:penicillin-binding protein activator [Alphaproteobacteria bacterium]
MPRIFLSLMAMVFVVTACGPAQTTITKPQASYFEKPSFQSINRFGKGTSADINKRADGRHGVAILLPISSEDESVRNLAMELFRAIELAMFDLDRDDLVLILEDTKGTPDGARAAAQIAIRKGAEIIIGPLFSASVRAVADETTRAAIPVLALSNDRRVAEPGVWVIGQLPEQTLDRIIQYATQNGLTRFAALLPDNEYGTRLSEYIEPVINEYGGTLVALETYPNDAEKMFEPAQKIAFFKQRKTAHKNERERLLNQARLILPEIKDEATLIKTLKVDAKPLFDAIQALERTETIGEIPYDAVLIPDGGLSLRNVSPLLPYFDIDPKFVQFLGSGLWDDVSLLNEPPLNGGWYPAPNPAGWELLSRHYNRAYGAEPPRLVSLVYDAVSLVGTLLAQDQATPFAFQNMIQPDGFIGIDGPFRLSPDGTNERSFAIMQIARKKAQVISPAPTSFAEINQMRQTARAMAEENAKTSALSWQDRTRPNLSIFAE